MSGESGGIIIGGILMVGALGVVLTGAAAYGAVRLGIAAAKAGVRAYTHHQQRKQMENMQVSQELNELYAKMQHALDNQAALSDKYRQDLAKELEQASVRLEEMARMDNQAVSNWQSKLDTAREALATKVRQNGKAHRDSIAAQTRAEMTQLIAETESAREALQRSVDWNSRQAEHVAMQKSLAATLLHDAAASVKLLASLDTGMTNGFSSRVSVLKANMAAAQPHFDNGMWDLCAADCQDLIFRSARLALEQSQKQLEADEMRADLTARLEGLAAQLEACRHVQFLDEYLNEDVKEDLNDFSQGEYARLQQRIHELLTQIQSVAMTTEQLQLLHSQINNTIEGNVNTVIATAHQRLLAYYQKMRTMEELTLHMERQNYTMDWACNPGDDPTQPLSVRFTNNASQNSVVVTLHDDMTATDMNRMLMDLDVFFANGRTMTEPEKQALRSHMTQALSAAGLQGNLACTGRVNQESARSELREEESIRATAAVPIFNSTPVE